MPRTTPRPFGSRLLGPADQEAGRLRVRVQLLLTVLLVSTNLIGAVVVFVLSTLVIPGPTANRGTIVSLAIAVPTYVAVAIAVGTTWGTRRTLKALRWAIEDTEPSEADRRRTLRAARGLTMMQAVLWIVASVLFTTLALVFQPGRALNTASTVGIASVVVVSIAFLFSEFALRPIAAIALDEGSMTRPHGLGVAARVLVFWWLGTGAPVLGLVVVAILSLTTDQLGETKLGVVALVLGGVVLLFGFMVMWLTSRALVAPVLGVTDALREVEKGRFDQRIQVFDGSELGMLQAGFNRMSAGLAEREQLRDVFGRQVGRDVAAGALDDIALGGEAREVSVLFVDLVGSTTYAAEREPAEVVDVLNRFFDVVIEEVDAQYGLVNKFMGDAVLAVFGAPLDLDDHPGAALAASRRIAERLSAEVTQIRAGIGVASGSAVAGYVGSESRFEYTVIGDAVNAAARLTELAKDVDGGLLVDLATVRSANEDEAAHWVPEGSTTLRGRSTPTETAVPGTGDGEGIS